MLEHYRLWNVNISFGFTSIASPIDSASKYYYSGDIVVLLHTLRVSIPNKSRVWSIAWNDEKTL